MDRFNTSKKKKKEITDGYLGVANTLVTCFNWTVILLTAWQEQKRDLTAIGFNRRKRGC